MADMRQLIQTHSQVIGEPYSGDEILVQGYKLPTDFWAVVRAANGFVTNCGLFRFFPVQDERERSIQDQNTSEWVKSYGSLLCRYIVIAEDIFGDLYGYDTSSADLVLAKFYCEGGKVEPCAPADLREFLCDRVLVDRPTAFDSALAREAFMAGIACSADEHLAFTLPLVTGGEYSIHNLDVEKRDIHLGVLGQLSLSNRDLREGTRIARFKEIP